MAEEEVAASPAPADHKRKLEEVEPEAPVPHATTPHGLNVEPDGDSPDDDSTVVFDSSQSKRPRLDETTDGLEARENGSQAAKVDDHLDEEKQVEVKEEEQEKPAEEMVKNQDGETPAEEVLEPIQAEEVEAKIGDLVNKPSDDPSSEDVHKASVEVITSEEPVVGGRKEVDDGISPKEVDDSQSTTRRIEVPSSKVGVLIGKGGDTIRYLQFNSGAKIQILRDAEADPSSASRPVEIIGSLISIEKAEKLIHAVIAEAEAGGSPALVARGLAATNAIGVPEQIEIKVPNDKVGLIIGRGGETIKNMQTRSGARIQLIPQHAEGDGSKERTVRISGDKRQIDIATDMIKDVMYQNLRSSHYSGGFNQPSYRPRGPHGPPQWGSSRGPHASHPIPYDFHHHRGPYPSPSSHYPPPSYGGYPPQHMPPRSGFGDSGWDPRPSHTGPYDYYGRQGPPSSAPLPTPASGHGPGPMGLPPPSQGGYGYGQGHGHEYGHGAPYSHTGPQQGYGQTYEQPKYENPPPMHQPYGGPQPGYPQAHSGQMGYAAQPQPQGRPYGMQGPSPQPYGPPRMAPPGDMPYQGATPAAPPYGASMAPQQQYAYGSSGPMHQSYPLFGSVAPSDGYSTQAPATGQTYQQQAVQPVSAHDQPGVHQTTAGYGQVPPTGGYSSYPSSQQPYGNASAQNSGNYGYPATQDPSYGGGNPSMYGAAPGGQAAYPQAAPVQAGYEQSVPQSTGYPAVPGSAPVKSLSPQPGYPHYDANQVYSTPR